MTADGVPFAVVDVAAGEAQPPGARKLVMARTDQHVAWRGDAIPTIPRISSASCSAKTSTLFPRDT